MPVQLLKEFLDSNNIKYISISHSPAFTAQGIAALTHTPGKELAKTVIVSLDDELAMAVLPASHQVNLCALRDGAKAGAIRLAYDDFQRLVRPQVLNFARLTGVTAA